MLDLFVADRWRPNRALVSVLLSLSIFLLALTSAINEVRGPIFLGYHVVRTARAQWRVTTVWPSSFAWSEDLRAGNLIQATTAPAARGSAILHVWSHGCCQTIRLSPFPAADPLLIDVELALAIGFVAIGAGTVLFARARQAALLLLAFCLTVSLGLCGVAAFAHGAAWGSVLLELCWLGLLPPLSFLLASYLPPIDRPFPHVGALAALYGSVVCSIEVIGFVDVSVYTTVHDITEPLFIAGQIIAIGIWLWRALPARSTPRWPEYRLLLLGYGGAFGGLALFAFLPTLLTITLPWPIELGGLFLFVFPACMSWALLRHQLLELRRSLQRSAITAGLLGFVLCFGLTLALTVQGAIKVVVLVLMAGIGVPLAQRAVDHYFPDGRAIYASLLQRSGEALNVAVTFDDVCGVLEMVCDDLGLTGLSLHRNDLVLARAGHTDGPASALLAVLHNADDMATLVVGEKRHHDTLLAADRIALAMLCQQLGAFLARQRLLLTLCETIARLEESQERLLTARRLERERLGQLLHRGPLQDSILLYKRLPIASEEAALARRLESGLRAVLTETASTMLQHLGLPAALRAHVAYLSSTTTEMACRVAIEVDDAAATLDKDASFALYQLGHEALLNAVRHSGGRLVQLCLMLRDDRVELTIADDGCGLPADWEQARIDHHGLRDALDLVRTVRGATASAASAVGGTLIRACVPFHAHQRQQEETQTVTAGTIRILIAEDHVVVRQGLRRVLMEDPRLHVVAEASTGHEIIGLVLQHRPDIVVLDLDLPGQNGLDAVCTMQAHVSSPPRVLVLSAFCDEEYVRRARSLGVNGFLSKNCEEDELRQAVHQIAAGGLAFAPEVEVISREQRYNKGRFRGYTDGSEALTSAELVVLQKMMGDQSYEEIAQALGRSTATVRSQAITICEKLGVNSRSQAVIKGLQLGILRLYSAQLGREG